MSMTRSTSRIGSALRAGPKLHCDKLSWEKLSCDSLRRNSLGDVRRCEPVVTLESVVKRYGKTEALPGFDLTLRRGEVVALPSVV